MNQTSDGKADRRVKIAVVSTSMADYGRLLPLLKELQSRPQVQLQVVLGTPVYADHFWWHLRYGNPSSLFKSLPWYLKARLTMMHRGERALSEIDQLAALFKRDHVPIAARIPLHVEGADHTSMLHIAGLALLGAADVFGHLRPDAIVVHGDRAELLTIAAAATMLHIPLVHIEGGDVSGTVDEHVRHAISKLAHLHFPITKRSAERLIAMGERPDRVVVSGMLAIDAVAQTNLALDNSFFDRVPGVGRIDFAKPFVFVIYHPVTTKAHDAEHDARALMAALAEIGLPLFILAPNTDVGGRAIHEVFRAYAAEHPERAAFYKRVPADEFYRLLNGAAVCVGNSSSFVRESAYLGSPVVLVGNRQHNREHGENLVQVPCDQKHVTAAVEAQLAHGRYTRDTRFGIGQSAKKIVDALLAADLPHFDFQKVFHERA